MTTEVMDSSADATVNAEIQNNSTTVQNPDNGQADMVSKEEYLNAQSFGTKARQAEIAMAKKLALKDSAELHAIEDSKVKDAVTKEILWMSYAEASAVMGANFDITTINDDKSGNPTDDTQVMKKLRLLEFKESQREKDAAIAAYQAANPDMFVGDAAAMKERIDKELEYISTSLPIEERIKRAATASIGNPMDKTSLAYNLLLKGTASNPNASVNPQEVAKTKADTIANEIRELWKLPTKK